MSAYVAVQFLNVFDNGAAQSNNTGSSVGVVAANRPARTGSSRPFEQHIGIDCVLLCQL